MKTLLSIIFTLFIYSFAFTQDQDPDQVDFVYTVESKAFDKERKYYVHLPERYYENKEEKFGVIYVLDGQGKAYFNNAKSIIDYLVWSYQIMPVIVVGIHSDNRGTEFIPLDRSLPKDSDDNNGQAHLLKQHIAEEIFPSISEKFRINDFRALIGHSRGGAFIANTLFSEERDLFNAYLAISPGMHYLNEQILNDVREFIKKETKFNKFYYCTHGTVGNLERYFKPQVNLIDSLLKVYPNKTLAWSKKEFEGTTHWSVVAPSLVYGLMEMNRAFQVDQYLIEQYAKNNKGSIKEQIEKREEEQKEIFEFTIPMDAPSLRYYGNQQAENEAYAKAIELYDLSIQKDPDNIRTHNSKARAYRELGNKSEAIKAYKKALEVVEVNKLKLSEKKVEDWKKNFQSNLDKLMK